MVFATGERLGAAGLIVALFGIAAFYLWPDKRWIGWLSLIIAGVLCLAWFVLEIKQALGGSRTSMLLAIGAGSVLGAAIGWIIWQSSLAPTVPGDMESPSFHIVLYDMALIPWRDDPSYAAVCLITGIANSGSPSVARLFKLSIPKKDGGAFEGILSSVGLSPWTIQVAQAKFNVTLREEDSLPNKTIRSAIPRGGEETGYILARFPGIPSGKIGALGNGVTVQVEDIKGHKYSRTLNVSDALGYTPYYPGTRLNDTSPLPKTQIFSVELGPGVNEDTAKSLDITGATVIAVNQTQGVLKNINQLFVFPTIRNVTIEERHRKRMRIESGGTRGSQFVYFYIPELLPGEHHYANIAFAAPVPFTSCDVWRRTYGYGEDIPVYRLFVGPMH